MVIVKLILFSGDTLLRYIRSNMDYKNAHIIVLTSSYSVADKTRCDDYEVNEDGEKLAKLVEKLVIKVYEQTREEEGKEKKGVQKSRSWSFTLAEPRED